MRDVMHTTPATAGNKAPLAKRGGLFYAFFGKVTSVILPTARKSRDATRSQNSAGCAGALRYGGGEHDAGFGSTSDVHGRRTSWTWGVSGKMPRRRQGLQQSMYLAIPNQGTRVAR